MDGVQKQQAIALADEFLHELVQELDHEDIVGITLAQERDVNGMFFRLILRRTTTKQP